jgi:hypothetical protein
MEQSEFLVMYNMGNGEIYETHRANDLKEIETIITSIERYPYDVPFSLDYVEVYEIKRRLDTKELIRNNNSLNWHAEGDRSNSTITIFKNNVPVACILSEQVIHGLDYISGAELKSELRLSYLDILQSLGLA